MSDRRDTTPRLTREGLNAYLGAQAVASRSDCAVVCPVCGAVQSVRSMMAAGVSQDQAEKALGFNCIGRYTDGRSAFTKGKGGAGPGCTYTMGGLFRLPGLIVVNDKGEDELFFRLATPDEAQALASKGGAA